MRRLIRHLERARAHHQENNERGAVAIIVALSLVVLLGFVALTVDAGAMYEERAELQNAADSAALAVAQQCAGGGSCDAASGETKDLANKYAQANLRDGSVKVSSIIFNGAKVTVTVLTDDAAEGDAENNRLDLTFAPLIGVDDAEIGAKATAAWGYPDSGISPLPIVFSRCEFKLNTGDQLLQLHGTGNVKNASTAGTDLQISSGLYTGTESGATTAGLQTLDAAQIVPASAVVPAGVPMVPAGEGPSPSPTPTETIPPTVSEGCEDYVTESGLLLPGGFGDVDPDAGNKGCAVTLENGQEIGSGPGKSLPESCEDVLQASIGKVVLLPIYNDYGGTGNTGWYTVEGWAAFKITGYHFPGMKSYASNNTLTPELTCKNQCAGLIGQFVEFTDLDDGSYTTSPDAPNFGASIVSLED